MKHHLLSKLLFAVAICFCSCAAINTIDYQNAAVQDREVTLTHDVETLTTSKTMAPRPAYDPIVYAGIRADANACTRLLATLPKSGLSQNQLVHFLNSLEIYRKHDTASAWDVQTFLNVNGPPLVQMTRDIDTLQSLKLAHP